MDETTRNRFASHDDRGRERHCMSRKVSIYQYNVNWWHQWPSVFVFELSKRLINNCRPSNYVHRRDDGILFTNSFDVEWFIAMHSDCLKPLSLCWCVNWTKFMRLLAAELLIIAAYAQRKVTINSVRWSSIDYFRQMSRRCTFRVTSRTQCIAFVFFQFLFVSIRTESWALCSNPNKIKPTKTAVNFHKNRVLLSEMRDHHLDICTLSEWAVSTSRSG